MHIHGKICPGGKWLLELMKFWLLLLKYGYRISIAYGLDMFFLPLVVKNHIQVKGDGNAISISQ